MMVECMWANMDTWSKLCKLNYYKLAMMDMMINKLLVWDQWCCIYFSCNKVTHHALSDLIIKHVDVKSYKILSLKCFTSDKILAITTLDMTHYHGCTMRLDAHLSLHSLMVQVHSCTKLHQHWVLHWHWTGTAVLQPVLTPLQRRHLLGRWPIQSYSVSSSYHYHHSLYYCSVQCSGPPQVGWGESMWPSLLCCLQVLLIVSWW